MHCLILCGSRKNFGTDFQNFYKIVKFTSKLLAAAIHQDTNKKVKIALAETLVISKFHNLFDLIFCLFVKP